jgi:cyclophilin family peptidyl-prolyl cis-trans isomerase
MRHTLALAAIVAIGAVSAARADDAAPPASSPATTTTASEPAQSEAAKPETAKTDAKSEAAKPAAPKAATGPQVAVMETAQGIIVIKFDEASAPKTVANFKKLVKQKYYDGTTFHRVIPGFMIQGGDPNSRDENLSDDGMGGPGYTVPAEIKAKHVRGSIATARLGDQANPARASSGSQFFIDVAPQPSLDAGGYTVFGEVISGIDVVDKIVALGKDPSTPRGPSGPNPGKKALIKRVTLEPLVKWEKPAQASTTP